MMHQCFLYRAVGFSCISVPSGPKIRTSHKILTFLMLECSTAFNPLLSSISERS